MDIKFADSFGDSIKTLIRHQTWWYKTYETIRYKIPYFFKNIYKFRHVLWEHRWWDYRFTLTTLRTSLEIMEKGMHAGLEVRESRDKKIAKMQRVIQILKNIEEDNYIQMAETELGEIIHHDWEFEETEETIDNPLGEKNEKSNRTHRLNPALGWLFKQLNCRRSRRKRVFCQSRGSWSNHFRCSHPRRVHEWFHSRRTEH